MQAFVVYSKFTGVVSIQGQVLDRETAMSHEQGDDFVLLVDSIPPGALYVENRQLMSAGIPPAPWMRFNLTTKEWEDVRTVQELRAVQYPPLQEFADAFYWFQKGDASKMNAYLAACEKVKNDLPK